MGIEKSFEPFKSKVRLVKKGERKEKPKNEKPLPKELEISEEEVLENIKFSDNEVKEKDLEKIFPFLRGIIPYLEEEEIKELVKERSEIFRQAEENKKDRNDSGLTKAMLARLNRIKIILRKKEKKYQEAFKNIMEIKSKFLRKRKIIKENLSEEEKEKFIFVKNIENKNYVFSRPRLDAASREKVNDFFLELMRVGKLIKEAKKRRKKRRGKQTYFDKQIKRTYEDKCEKRIQKIIQQARREKVRVGFLDSQGRLCAEEWPLREYLWRMGVEHKVIDDNRVSVGVSIEGDVGHLDSQKFFSKLAFFLAKEKIKKSEDIDFEKNVLQWQEEAIEKRKKEGYEYDDKLVEERSHESRVRQIDSQYEEDPFFASLIREGGYLFTEDLPFYCDYFDKIDVLAGVDIDDLRKGKTREKREGEIKNSPLYLGAQRTLAKSKGIIRTKKKDIEKAPFAFIPEYPEKNPIFVFLFPENKEEYYLREKDEKGRRIPRWEALREINEQRIKQGKPKWRADKAWVANTKKEMEEILSQPLFLDKKIKESLKKRIIEKNVELLEAAIKGLNLFLKKMQNKGRENSYYYKLALVYKEEVLAAKRIIEEDNEEILKGNNNK